MSRPQPQAARPWLWRGLLVLLALAGLGVWQGAHCVDTPPAYGSPSVAVLSADPPEAAVVSAHRHSQALGGQLLDGPATAADGCHIAPATATTTTVAAAPLPLALQRTVAVGARPRSLTPCFSPGVTLTRLGVSRT